MWIFSSFSLQLQTGKCYYCAFYCYHSDLGLCHSTTDAWRGHDETCLRSHGLAAMSSSTASSSTPTRKISFPLEALFQSAIQDGDNEELWRMLHEFSKDLDINETNHAGLTPLHYSVLSNNLDGVKMLLGYGADVNIADCHGFTPLHTAAACGYMQMASYLIIFGANVFAVTDEGDLPVDIAKDSSTTAILTDQMILHIQRSEYVNSWLVYHTKELIRIVFHTLLFLVSSFLTFISDLFTNLHSDQSSKPQPLDKKHKNNKTD